MRSDGILTILVGKTKKFRLPCFPSLAIVIIRYSDSNLSSLLRLGFLPLTWIPPAEFHPGQSANKKRSCERSVFCSVLKLYSAWISNDSGRSERSRSVLVGHSSKYWNSFNSRLVRLRMSVFAKEDACLQHTQFLVSFIVPNWRPSISGQDKR